MGDDVRHHADAGSGRDSAGQAALGHGADRHGPDGQSPVEQGPGSGPIGEVAAWAYLSYLITGPALYGGLGWLLDRWLGTGFLLPIGIVGGMALAIYVIVVRTRGS